MLALGHIYNLYTRKNAITIPAAAVQRGSQGTYVYIVKQDKSAESRTIKIALTEGTVAVLDAGVNPGELVITDGQERLQPGNKVEVQRTGPPGRVGTSDQSLGAGNGS